MNATAIPKLRIESLHERHTGLTASLAGTFFEAASVCLGRHHISPVEMIIACDGNASTQTVEFPMADVRILSAYANDIDTTEAGAYGVSLAAVESKEQLIAVRRAETLTGADWYVAPIGTEPDDLESCWRLEVSGVDAGGLTVVEARLRQKIDQTKRGASNLPAIAVCCRIQGKSYRNSESERQQMSWTELHTKSEQLAIEAQSALKARNTEQALDLYRRAAEVERLALDQLDVSKVRTRGITAVSAVALWFKAGEYSHAEQLAHLMLADDHVPDFAREELRNLVQAIWTESSKQKAGVTFIPGQVMVSVKGGEVVTGGAPLDLIVDKIQTIQSMFYRTIEFLNGVSHRRVGRPARELQESCRAWLFQSVPGSYQFSVAIQKPTQQDFFSKEIEPERIAQHFLEIVSASSGDDTAELERIVPDENYRSTFLKLARNLAPTGKAFDRIELRASDETRPVALSAESRGNINQQLRKKVSLLVKADEVPEELRGTLPAVDLDENWLDIVVDGKSMHIVGLQDAVDDVIGPMVNRDVVVRSY